MPKVSDVYAGDYVNASQLPTDRRVTALIASAVAETVGRGSDVKLVLELSNTAGQPWPRRLVLNKSNALILANAFGNDTDFWIGKAIELWSAPTKFDGQDTMGIQLAPVGNGSTSTAIVKPAPKSGPAWDVPGGDLDDEITF